MSEALRVTDRTRVRRRSARGSHERAVVEAILDEALVCHIAFVSEGTPVVLPTTHVRIADRIYVHGSVANHMLRTLAAGPEVAIAVTLLDGLVFSRSAFHHSANYRSVVVFGCATEVVDPSEKRRALAAMLDKLAPGRSAACREPNDKELATTLVIALPIDEASAKIRSGPPLADDPEDALLPYWAGVIPVSLSRGAPITAPDCAVPPPPGQ